MHISQDTKQKTLLILPRKNKCLWMDAKNIHTFIFIFNNPCAVSFLKTLCSLFNILTPYFRVYILHTLHPFEKLTNLHTLYTEKKKG